MSYKNETRFLQANEISKISKEDSVCLWGSYYSNVGLFEFFSLRHIDKFWFWTQHTYFMKAKT